MVHLFFFINYLEKVGSPKGRRQTGGAKPWTDVPFKSLFNIGYT